MSKVFRQAAAEIKAGRLFSVYLLVGTEEYGKKKFLDLLCSTVVDPSMAEFNYDQLQASEIKAVAVLDKAGMLPMMADRRLIIVEGCDKWLKNDLTVLTKYLESVNDKTCLVLQFEAADNRKKLFKMQSREIRRLDFVRPKRWELAEYIGELVVDMKLRLNNDAVNLVAEMVGDDLTKVYQELEKLSLYKLGSNEITTEDVNLLMGRTRHVTRWELNEFIGRRDLGATLIKMHDILDSGEEPISLLSTVNGYIRQLFVAKALATRGVRDRGQVGQVLGVPPKIAQDIMNSQKSYSDPELRQAFALLKETDIRLKSYAMNRRLLLDHLVASIVQPGPLSPPPFNRR